jgi:hypothetical protein
MPSYLDIWHGAVKVLTTQWFAWHGDGLTEVLIDIDADLEAVQQAVVRDRRRLTERLNAPLSAFAPSQPRAAS